MAVKKMQPPRRQDAELETECQRCGRPARGGTGSPDARLLRRAQTGVCVECGVVEFLQRLDAMHGGKLFSQHGPAAALRLPHVQQQFAATMAAGHSDATFAEIDWERVIEVWDIAPARTDELF